MGAALETWLQHSEVPMNSLSLTLALSLAAPAAPPPSCPQATPQDAPTSSDRQELADPEQAAKIALIERAMAALGARGRPQDAAALERAIEARMLSLGGTRGAALDLAFERAPSSTEVATLLFEVAPDLGGGAQTYALKELAQELMNQRTPGLDASLAELPLFERACAALVLAGHVAESAELGLARNVRRARIGEGAPLETWMAGGEAPRGMRLVELLLLAARSLAQQGDPKAADETALLAEREAEAHHSWTADRQRDLALLERARKALVEAGRQAPAARVSRAVRAHESILAGDLGLTAERSSSPPATELAKHVADALELVPDSDPLASELAEYSLRLELESVRATRRAQTTIDYLQSRAKTLREAGEIALAEKVERTLEVRELSLEAPGGPAVRAARALAPERDELAAALSRSMELSGEAAPSDSPTELESATPTDAVEARLRALEERVGELTESLNGLQAELARLASTHRPEEPR